MLQVSDLSKSYLGVPLFQGLTFSVGRGEIIGLVGRNGSGKSTLLKIICGLEGHDSGRLGTPKGYKLGYLDQHIRFTMGTLLEECCLALGPEEQYDHYKAEKILFGLGFTEPDLTRHPTEFSGGFQLRINLTKTLLGAPDLLLLDEPTNYLDILSLRWLRGFLKGFRGEVIIVTHDRDFMDSVVTHTMGIHRGSLLKIKGDTSKYYTQLMAAEEVHEKTRLNQEKKISEMQKFVDRFGAKASKASQARSRARQIEKIKVLGEIRPEEKLGFRFNYRDTPAKTLMEAKGLAFSYPGTENLFEDLSFRIRPGDRVAVIGKNGKGKTTLLNVLAGKARPAAGTVSLHPGAEVGYYEQTNRKDLDPESTVAGEIARANPALSITAGRSICGAMMFPGDAAEKKISVLSGGEQSRVLLGKVLAHPTNLLLLDEPSNHLDMDSIEVMTEELEKFPGGVVLVTHNEEMLRRLANRLIVFQWDRAEVFDGTYDEFLDSVGWEGEEAKRPKKPSSGKRNKAGAGQAGSVGPNLKKLEKEYSAMEEELSGLEKALGEKNAEALSLARDKSPGERIQELYKTIAGLQAEINCLHEKMEELLSRIDGLGAGG